MKMKKRIFAILGSASRNSANLHIVQHLARISTDSFVIDICDELKTLPHFDPELSVENPPEQIRAFRKAIEIADGILICTPEYVFSIPSGLKNAIEWCVATTVFSGKPVGLITASSHGAKGHEELQLIMRTVMAKFTEETTLLIQGVKGKINERGEIIDEVTKEYLTRFIHLYRTLLLD